jgi:hypothetical protein
MGKRLKKWRMTFGACICARACCARRNLFPATRDDDRSARPWLVKEERHHCLGWRWWPLTVAYIISLVGPLSHILACLCVIFRSTYTGTRHPCCLICADPCSFGFYRVRVCGAATQTPIIATQHLQWQMTHLWVGCECWELVIHHTSTWARQQIKGSEAAASVYIVLMPNHSTCTCDASLSLQSIGSHPLTCGKIT